MSFPRCVALILSITILSSFCACKNGLFAKKGHPEHPDPYLQTELGDPSPSQMSGWNPGPNQSQTHAQVQNQVPSQYHAQGAGNNIAARADSGKVQPYSPVGYNANIQGQQYPSNTSGAYYPEQNRYPDQQWNQGYDNRMAMRPQQEYRNEFTLPAEPVIEEETSIGFPKLFKPSREKGDDPFEQYPGFSRTETREKTDNSLDSNGVFRQVSYTRQFDDEDWSSIDEGFGTLPSTQSENRTNTNRNGNGQQPGVTSVTLPPRSASPPIREYLPIKHSPGLANDAEMGRVSRSYNATASRTHNDTWRPDGVSGYWPQDEYIADGGVNRGKPLVRKDWTVEGISPEDTVVHYDTVDGRVVIEPTNRVHLYSPRFGSVRKIDSPNASSSRIQLTAARNTQEPVLGNSSVRANNTVQEYGSRYARSKVQASDLEANLKTIGMGSNLAPAESKGNVQPFAFANALMKSEIDSSAMPHIAEASNNAIQWAGTQETKVRFNSEAAYKVVNHDKTATVYALDEKTTSDQLRIVKVASKDTAKVGDTVEFTIRFENIGSQPIGNVTIIDSLSGRLELIPDSVEASLATGFSVEKNEAGSLLLRWEINDALPAPAINQPKPFGVIRFHCRVR